MRETRRLGWRGRLLLAAVLAAVPAVAQMGGGSVSGTLTDPSGAVVAGAEITIEKPDTHETRHVVTSSAGLYSATNLGPGVYRLTVTRQGFSTLQRTGILIEVGSSVVVDLQLQLGSTGQSVEVKGDAPALETASSDLGGVNNGQTVRELPLNGRDWTSLATLQPGVTVIRTEAAVGAGLANTRGNRGLGQMMAISGNRPEQNNYRLDGVSVNDYAGSGPASVLGVALGVDAIQEFSVVTNNAPADYGKTSGGVINAVTRAGTDAFHGAGYEFLRNSAMDARNFFDGLTIPPFKRNQFGGSVGGPVVKDNTFFFVDYEGLRQGLGVTTVDTVPSAAAHSGNLVAGPVTVSPLVAPYLALFPLPNAGTNGDAGTYEFAAQNITTENFITTRMDHRFSDNDLLHGTYLWDHGQTAGPDAFNFVEDGTVSRRQTGNLEESHIFSPNIVNFVRMGINRVVAEQVASLAAINPQADNPALSFVPGRDVGQINIGGYTLFLGGLGAIGDYHFNYTSWQEYDDLAISHGKHSLKMGAGIERDDSNQVGAGASNGTATFGSLKNFLTNVPSSFAANVPGTGSMLGMRQSIFGAYLQDDWRVRHNLTLNLGIRYEMATVPTEEHGRLATLTSLSSPTVHLGSPYFNNPTTRDFSPRVGFAWTPFANGKTVFRGGFGIYDSLPLTYEFALLSSLSAPYLEQGSSTSVTAGSFPNGLYASVAGGALRTAFIEQNPKANYVEQWNFNIQRELGKDVMWEVAYVGTHGVHSPFLSSDINDVQPTLTPAGYEWPTPQGSGIKPLPTVGNATALFWQVSSEYEAVRTRVQKRLGHGFQALGAYTLSKSLDTGSNSIQTAYTNTISSLPFFNAALRRGPSDFDQRQTATISGIWEVPAWKTSVKPLAWLEQGWQFGTILQISSGLPFTATISGDALGTNSSVPFDFPMRLNAPGCNNPVNPGNPNAYIKLQCFAAPAPITLLGDAGRNELTGPGLMNLDWSAVRNFGVPKISEAFRIQFRAELFNIVNHANFSPPNSTGEQVFALSGKGTTAVLNPIPTAGSLASTTTTSRQIQFALKVIF
jgi:hypothetical protein